MHSRFSKQGGARARLGRICPPSLRGYSTYTWFGDFSYTDISVLNDASWDSCDVSECVDGAVRFTPYPVVVFCDARTCPVTSTGGSCAVQRVRAFVWLQYDRSHPQDHSCGDSLSLQFHIHSSPCSMMKISLTCHVGCKSPRWWMERHFCSKSGVRRCWRHAASAPLCGAFENK